MIAQLTLADAILSVLRKADGPMKLADLATRLDDQAGFTYGSVQQELARLRREGDIVRVRKGFYTASADETPLSLPLTEEVTGRREKEQGPMFQHLAADGPPFVLPLFARLSIADEDGAHTGESSFACIPVDSKQVYLGRQFFAQLLGFWPPDDLAGIYVENGGRPELGAAGTLVLYLPTDRWSSGARHVVGIEDVQTGDVRTVTKRVQVVSGGALRLIAENAVYERDELLVPTGDGDYREHETGLTARICCVGRVVWPTESDAAADVERAVQIIQGLTSTGVLKIAA